MWKCYLSLYVNLNLSCCLKYLLKLVTRNSFFFICASVMLTALSAWIDLQHRRSITSFVCCSYLYRMCSPDMLNNHVLEGAHIHARCKEQIQFKSPQSVPGHSSDKSRKLTFQQKQKSRKTLCAVLCLCFAFLVWLISI